MDLDATRTEEEKKQGVQSNVK